MAPLLHLAPAMHRFLLMLVALTALSASCASPRTTAPSTDPQSWLPDDQKSDDPWACPDPPAEEISWRHSIKTPLSILASSPHHGAVDAITNPGQEVTVTARFSYGLRLKDLEDETVSLWLQGDHCNWTRIADAITDDDGFAEVTVPGGRIAKPGRHDFQMIVGGDLSRAYGSVWVMDPDTPLVVFDVDGTLTSGDVELAEELLTGEEPEMYQGADEVAWAYVEAGYQPVFLTGRPLYLDSTTRSWLGRRGFPRGPLDMARDLGDALPDGGGVGDFKQGELEDWQQRAGLSIPYAYGNATTDICAYAGAGIDPAHTYIIGSHAGEACGDGPATEAISDYPTHLAGLELPPAD